jgi:phosphoribosylformimino-5-aminoimidazole carboxamide ribotide isomerase
MPIWLDAGIADADEALAIARRGSSRIVVGSETVRSMASLGELALAVGGERVAFSLDLRNGGVLAPHDTKPDAPETIAARVTDAGIRALIVLDLARVGTGNGLDVGLLSRIRAAAPGVTLLAGGGIAGPDDLRTAEEAGCDGVLIASALLDGRLAAADVRHAMSRR